MHPIDKPRIFLNFFVLTTHGKGTQKDVTNPPQWDGFLYVLNTSDLRSLSLDGEENPNKNGTQRELTSKKIEKYDNDGGSKSDQKYRSRVIFRHQKIVSECKNPYIYKKILSQSRYWRIVKILLIKSRSNFYGIHCYFLLEGKGI